MTAGEKLFLHSWPFYLFWQVCMEGEISRQSIMNSLSRGKKASGDLIPWTISEQVNNFGCVFTPVISCSIIACFQSILSNSSWLLSLMQFQDPDFGALSGGRVVRIAVHPDYQGVKYCETQLLSTASRGTSSQADQSFVWPSMQCRCNDAYCESTKCSHWCLVFSERQRYAMAITVLSWAPDWALVVILVIHQVLWYFSPWSSHVAIKIRFCSGWIIFKLMIVNGFVRGKCRPALENRSVFLLTVYFSYFTDGLWQQSSEFTADVLWRQIPMFGRKTNPKAKRNCNCKQWGMELSTFIAFSLVLNYLLLTVNLSINLSK